MNCPKCGRQNHDQAHICFYCHYPLSYVAATPPEQDVRTSKLAVASCILGVLGLPFFLIYGSMAMQAYGLPPLSIFAYASFFSAILAVFLGLAALACIEINYGRLTGRAYAAIGIAIPLIAFFLTAAHASLANMRGTALRMTCSTNLSGLGKAMLIYANDYDGEMPRAGGPNSALGTTPNFQANTHNAAYGLDTKGSGGQASMSANFYLLVKYAEVTPKSFKCDRDPAFKEFKLAGYRSKTDFQTFDPNGPRKIIKRANALPHKGDGQNVLFIDAHTSFEKQPFCGVKDDNIYTPQTATDIRKGALPTLTAQPANRNDSLLLNDPSKGPKK